MKLRTLSALLPLGLALLSSHSLAQPIKQSSQTTVHNEQDAYPPLPHRHWNPREVYEQNGTTYVRDGQPCVFAPDLWIPYFSMVDRSLLSVTGLPGEFEDHLLCGKANIEYYFSLYSSGGHFRAMMPPQEFPPHLPPGQRIPDDNPAFPLSRCHFDDGVWDCDDYAYTWCRLQPDPKNCKVIFLFTYEFAHAMVIWRQQNPDGTWTVCIVEPSTGDKLACWQSATGELIVPQTYWEYVRGELCRFFSLDCESWWIESFWRFRYRDPNDWSWWLCGEDPWWECDNREDLAIVCDELRRHGIDPCPFNPSCPGCDGSGGGQQRTPK